MSRLAQYASENPSGQEAAPTVTRRQARVNRILAGLPAHELAALLPDLQLVRLAQHVILHETDAPIEHAYFPLTGVASLIASGDQGEQVDTAIIGNEGMVGLPIFLGTEQVPVRAAVLIEMIALRVPANRFRQAVERGGALPDLLQRYSQMVLVELAQLVLCNRVHRLENRVARWILQLDERLEHPAQFSMTQEFLAAMVSSPRPHVSELLQSFRERGLIDYSRGTMEVTDAAGLEAAACACYRRIRAELDRLLRTTPDIDDTD